MYSFNTTRVPIRTAMILTMVMAATFDGLGTEIPGPEGLRREDIKPGRYWQFYQDGSSTWDTRKTSQRDPNDFKGTRTLTVLEENPADQTILLLQEDFDGKQTFYSAGRIHSDRTSTPIANTNCNSSMLFPPTSGTTTPLVFWNFTYPETPMKLSVSNATDRMVITQSLKNAKILKKMPPEYADLNARIKHSFLQTQILIRSLDITHKLHNNTVISYETQYAGSLSVLTTDAPTQPNGWTVSGKQNLVATGVWDKTKIDAMIHEIKYVEKMKIRPTWADYAPDTFYEKCDLFEIERNSREYYKTFPNPMFQKTIKKYTHGKITVTDPDGKAVSGVMIGMMPENSRYLTLSFQGTTDAYGTFFPLDDLGKNSPKGTTQGTWVLAAAPGYPLISQLIPDPEKDTTITLEKNDDAFPLDIRITDSEGKPVDNAQVALVPVDDDIVSYVYPFLPEKMSGLLPFTYGAPEKLPTPGCLRYIINPYGSLPKRQSSGFSGLFQAMKHANMKAHIIVNQPGVITNVMTSQPITLAKQNAPFEVRLPKPTPLTLYITPPADALKDVQYKIKFTQTDILQVPGFVLTTRDRYLPNKADFVSLPLETSTTLLPPGDYSMEIDASNVYFPTQADDLSTQVSFVLKEGVPLNLKIRMQRCTPAEYSGNQTLKLKISKGTQPAAGAEFVLQAKRAPGKFIAVTSGTLDANGEAVIPNLRGDEDPDMPTYRLVFPCNRDDKTIEVPMPEDQQVVTFEKTVPPSLMAPAPDFEAIDIKTGKTVHLSDLRGKWVFLDFWATWCGPCQKPMEENQKLSMEMPEIQQGKLVIVGLSIDGNQKIVKNHIEDKGWTAPLQWWAGNGSFDSTTAAAYGIEGVPSSFMIDPEGVLRWKGHPASFNIKEFMETETKQ